MRSGRSGNRTSNGPAPSDGDSNPAGRADGVGDSPTGLGLFNLGMVPASITPPRSWRRAAWFAVLSSAAALTGLVLATTALVEQSTTSEGLQLPGIPRASRFPAPPERSTTGPVLLRREVHGAAAPGASTSVDPTPGSPPPPPPREPSTSPSRPTTAEPSATSSGTSTVPTTPPGEPGLGTTSVPTTEHSVLTLADVEAVEASSQRYFAAVCAGDLRRAYALTTGPLRAEGFAAFATRYAGYASIDVLAVSVRSNTTVTTLRLRGTDGSVRTRDRRLLLTFDEPPLVSSDDLVG